MYRWTGSGTINTTNVLGPETYQVRILSQVGGRRHEQHTGTSISSSTGGTLIAANTAAGDVFICTPGQSVAFSSTSTSSGTAQFHAEARHAHDSNPVAIFFSEKRHGS